MAKGWESSSVEDQIEQAQATKREAPKKRSTAQEMEAHRRREVLLLSRVRVERDLKASQNPRYREQLTKALSDLDAQISQLEE
jgi:hypothetical protein